MANRFVVAMMESESMSWMALGNTEDEAKEAILKKWNDHMTRLAEMDMYEHFDWESNKYESVEAMEWDYEITTVRLAPGECEAW